MNIIVAVFILAGLFFLFAGSVGIIRFPDFYTRLHPAGMLDSMGLLLTMAGVATYLLLHRGLSAASLLISLKVLLIVIFVFVTGPTATHAIIDAGIRAGLKPWNNKMPEKKHDDTAP